jgi:predicted ATPase
VIKKLRLKNFKNFKNAELSLGPFTVLIGENASGKSNLRDAFRFLHGISLGYSLADIFGEKSVRGSLQWSGIRGGTQEISFNREKTFSLSVDLRVENGEEYCYFIEVKPGKLGTKPIVYKEGLHNKDGKVIFIADSEYSTDEQNIEVKIPSLNRLENFSADLPVLTQLSELEMRSRVGEEPGDLFATSQVSDIFQALRFFNFNPDAMRKPSFPGQNTLGDQGENLSSVLQAICENPLQKKDLLEWLRELTPMDAVDFEFIPDQTGKVLVNLIEENGRKTSAYNASDGTLRFLGVLATLLGKSQLYRLLKPQINFFEEIENGIHPSRMHLLSQLIEQNTGDSYNIQVITTTHSPQLLRLLSQDSLADAALLYRLPGSPEARIKQFRDFPEEGWNIIQQKDVGELHESRWFEIITNFMEGEAIA